MPEESINMTKKAPKMTVDEIILQCDVLGKSIYRAYLKTKRLKRINNEIEIEALKYAMEPDYKKQLVCRARIACLELRYEQMRMDDDYQVYGLSIKNR